MTHDKVKTIVTNALGKGMKMDALTDLIVKLAEQAGLVEKETKAKDKK